MYWLSALIFWRGRDFSSENTAFILLEMPRLPRMCLRDIVRGIFSSVEFFRYWFRSWKNLIVEIVEIVELKEIVELWNPLKLVFFKT